MSASARLSIRRFIFAFFLFGFAAAPFSFAQTTTVTATGTAAPAEEITQMETLTVTAKTDLPPPETWYQTKIPGFDVLSNASERITKKLLQDFENFRIGLDAAWPIKASIRRPATLIFCSRNSFDQFIPRLDREQRDNMSSEAGRASVTLIGKEHDFIVLDLGTSTLSLSGADMDMSDFSGGMAAYEVDYYRLLYREYVHYLLSQAESLPPVWYEEGMLQIIQKLDVDSKGVRIGEVKSVGGSGKPPKNGAASASSLSPADESAEDAETAEGDAGIDIPGMETIADGDFNVVLHRRALLGFDAFFGVTRDSPVARNPIGNNVWAKQCYAFVHMCLYQLPNRYKGALEKLVARAAKEPVTEALFAECFGKPYKKFLYELRGYIEYTSYQMQDFRVRGKDRINSPPREMTQAPEGESARIKADALIVANNATAGLGTLRGAYGRGERDPEFLAAYGLAAFESNQSELARRMLSQAVAGKTKRGAAYAAYGKILLDDAMARPGATGNRITAAQLAVVLEPLFAARQFRPPSALTYETMARAWQQSAVAPKPENFAVIAEGLALFPRDEELVYLAALLAIRMNDAKAAGALVMHGSRIATSDAMRAKFELLKQTPMLAAPPPSVPAPAQPAE